ncbi:MAG: hypothetical protein ACPGU1_12635 [Myxococcota bacterium]
MTRRLMTIAMFCGLFCGCGSSIDSAAPEDTASAVEEGCLSAADCGAAQRCEAGVCLDIDQGSRGEPGDGSASVNFAPTVAITSPKPESLFMAGEPVLLIAQVADDGVLEQLDVHWHTNRGGDLGSATVDSSGRASLEVSDLLAGDHTLTVVVADQDEVWQQDSVTLTVDGRPNRPVIALSPKVPTVADDLIVTLVHSATDENRASDTLTYRYRWFADDVARPDLTGPTVPATATLRGQVWSVQVAASDPYGYGGSSVAEVTIGNAPPTCEEASLLPNMVETTTALTCLCSKREELDKGDKTADFCTFYDGDEVLAEVEGENGACVLDAAQTSRGMTIRCELTPADEISEGEVVTTETLLVDNAHPSQPKVVLAPEFGTVTDGFTCDVTKISVDADGDALTYETAWYVNGYPNAPPYPGPVAPIDLVRDGIGNPARGGDELHCEVVARDSVGEVSLPASSQVIEIANTPPSGGSCVVTPAEGVTATSVLTCTPSGAVDIDDDAIEWSYAWTVTGPGIDPQSTGGALTEITTYPPVTGPKLAGFHFQRDSLVSCVATPSDGAAEGASIDCGEPILVGNSLPTIWEVLLEPAGDIALNQPVTCTYAGWSDADEIDPVEVRYSWLQIAETEISLAEEGTDGFGETLIPSEAGLEPGDIITCIARPFNGPDEGEGTYATYNATIIADP